MSEVPLYLVFPTCKSVSQLEHHSTRLRAQPSGFVGGGRHLQTRAGFGQVSFGKRPSVSSPGSTYLSKCAYSSIFESQLPHKIVNLIFQSVTVNDKMPILWGS